APVEPVASTVTSAGTVNTGAAVSTTWTTNEPRVSRLLAVTEQTTVVSPSAKKLPEAGKQSGTIGFPAVSAAWGAGLNVTIAPRPSVASAVVSASVRLGGSALTLTLKVFKTP